MLWHVHLKAQPAYYQNRLVDYDMFYLIVVQRGALYYESAREKTALRPGAMAVLRVGSRFDLHTKAVGYSAVAVSVRNVDEAPYRGESRVLATTPEIAGLAEWTRRELTAPGAHGEPLVDAYGRAMVAHALRRLQELGAGEPRQAMQAYWASRAAAAIAGAVYTERTIDEILKPLGPSHRQLARHMQAHFGKSPKRYQLELKIDEARHLLEHTKLSVTSIAMELGFPSVQHFSKQFRALAGKPPTAWRT